MIQSDGPITVQQQEGKRRSHQDLHDDEPRVFDHTVEALKLVRIAQGRIQAGERNFEVTRVGEGPKIGIPQDKARRRMSELNPMYDLEDGWLRTLWRTFAQHQVNIRIRLVAELSTPTYRVMVEQP